MRRARAAIVGIVLAFTAVRPLAAAEPVDLELLLAIDVSGSIDHEEAVLQREGYLAALTHPQVIAAVKAGYLGRIAISYYEWAGDHYQRLVADWMLVHDEASAKRLADAIAAQPITTELWTSISGAIRYGIARFAESPYAGKRRVLDISGDGPNNRGGPVTVMRDQAVLAGITINGLPIINERPSRWGLPPSPNLDLYYQDCVIGGRGAFIVVAEDFKDFAAAIRRKLILEIADVAPGGAPLSKAGAGAPDAPGGAPLMARAEARDAPELALLRMAADRPRPRGGWRPPCDEGERQMFEYRDR